MAVSFNQLQQPLVEEGCQSEISSAVQCSGTMSQKTLSVNPHPFVNQYIEEIKNKAERDKNYIEEMKEKVKIWIIVNFYLSA